MAAPISPPLPPAWSRILEEIEAALTMSLSQVAEPAASSTFAKPSPSLKVPDVPEGWPSALASAEASAAASEAELARAEKMLRDWLAAVQASRVHLEEATSSRIR